MRWFLLLILFIHFFLLSCNNDQSTDSPPNIIFIMADDLGYNELGCYGQKIIKTPNINKLASDGIRFTQFYSGSPVCAPSRCVLLTGKHTGHAYVRDNYELGGYTDETEGGQLPLPEGTETIGIYLKQQGYVTGAIGRWGLGGPGSEGVPNKQGFDYFYGYLCQKQAHNYYPSHLWENDQWDTLNNTFFMAHQKLDGDPENIDSYEKYKGKDYTPDKMLEKITKFIENNKDTSFFLYLPLVVPHLAIQVPDDEPSLNEYMELIPDTPYVGSKGYLPHPYPRATYAAMITRMDRHVGRILDKLKRLDLDNNTIIFFTSDNGPTYGGIGGSDTDYFESNKPFSGKKGSVYEGGIRVPLIVHWPGNINSNIESHHIAGFQDIFATLSQITGGEKIYNDGISFYPELIGEPQTQHKYLYWEFPAYGEQVAVRMQNWKAVRKGLKKNSNAAIELYDLSKDIGEENNVAENFPDVVEQMDSIIFESHKPSEKFPFPALDSLRI